MKPQLLILFALLTLTVSCNKDDDNNADALAYVNNHYTLTDVTTPITGAEYLYADGDTYLYFKGAGVADYVQIIFADRDGAIPVGAFTYHGDRNSGYIESSNFWRGNVSNAQMPLGFAATGGSVIITNQPNGTYKITFIFVTDAGDAKGEYTGVLVPRQ